MPQRARQVKSTIEQDPFVYQFSWSDTDRRAMEDMFARALHEGLWFYHGGMSGPLWFSPDELRAEQKRGHFIWGAVNWSLRPAREYLAQIEAQMESLKDDRQKLLKRMSSNA